MARANQALGLDVGGSSIKHALVDLATGRPLAALASVPTPQPCSCDNLFDALAALALQAPAGIPLGIAMPSVIQHGVIHTAANLDSSLVGRDAARELGGRLRRPVALLNDADAAGLAEAHYGAARGVDGTVMMLTFGTGIGSAMLVGGRLWPNSELGHMEVDGIEGEQRAAARIRSAEQLSWPQWARRVNRYLKEINGLFWPELIVIGGGVTENWNEFAALLESRAPLKPAALGPAAGVVGAALAAAPGGTPGIAQDGV
jgi:polyphosphate glucokinase